MVLVDELIDMSIGDTGVIMSDITEREYTYLVRWDRTGDTIWMLDSEVRLNDTLEIPL